MPDRNNMPNFDYWKTKPCGISWLIMIIWASLQLRDDSTSQCLIRNCSETRCANAGQNQMIQHATSGSKARNDSIKYINTCNVVVHFRQVPMVCTYSTIEIWRNCKLLDSARHLQMHSASECADVWLGNAGYIQRASR